MKGDRWTPPGEFDEFTLLRKLGSGAMGQVYLARDRHLDRLVAIKFITILDAQTLARFYVESRAAARVEHPNILAVHRVGELDDRPYLITEYIRGTSLADLALPIPWERALDIALGLSRGLAAAHRRGVLHRDIKLANAMVDTRGEVKLLDFGLAKIIHGSAKPGPLHDRVRPNTSPHVLYLGASADTDFTSGSPARDPEHDVVTRNDGPVVAGGESDDTPRIDCGGVRADESAAPQLERELSEARLAEAEAVLKEGGAKLTNTGALLGTPHYMAPELWRGESASQASDVYALGVLIYCLCSGGPPVSAPSVKELVTKVLADDRPSLSVRAMGVDPRLAAIVDRCVRYEPSERFTSGEALFEALEELARENRAGALTEENPYRGLAAFDAAHRSAYFGRSEEVITVANRLRERSFVLIAGDSGVGKSSLCRAGVLPELTQASEGEASWSEVSLTPGRHPVSGLVSALARARKVDESALASATTGRLDRFRGLLADSPVEETTVIFIDQLEELVTLAPAGEAALASEVIRVIARGVPGLRLLAAVRGDFLTRVASLPGLRYELADALYFLYPMSSLAMRAAIVEPARVRGVDFESEELVDKLVKAGLDGSLPLLQFALAELWEARTPGSSTLRQRDLEKIDGVSGALARHADGVLTQLTVAQRRAARDLLLRLVTMDETRASLPRRELLGGSKDAAIALEAFVEARLIHIRDGDDGYPVHELAHETLIRDWVSLRVWLSEEKDTRELRCHLEHAAGEWERLERPSDGLWDGALLDEARRIDHEELTPRERDFLAQSAAHVRRRSRLRLGLLVGVPSVIAVSLTVGILLQRASQDQLINGHVEAAQALITQAHANNEAVDADRSSAFAAFDRGATSEGEELWQRARRSADEVRRTYTRAASHLETAFGVDPLREDTCALLTEVLLERARLAERDHRADSIEGLLLRAALYDRDGSGMARWLRPAQVRVFAPLNVEIAVQRYDRSQSPYVLEDTLDRIPRDAELKLAPGSYLWTFRADGDEPILLPLVLRRGESLELRVELSPDDVIPPGFIYVPAGEFLYGSDDDDDLRRSFFTAEPMHNVKTEHYLVSRFETTNAEWIEFLDALTPEELELRTPRSEAAAFQAAPVLTKSARGGWEIERRTGERIDRAGAGALLRVDGREGIDAYDWLQLPVTGISMVDAEAYLAWLNSSGKLPGARLCSEHEWERAARGADGRMFPHGDALAPSEANIDTTYGRLPSAFAPDVVASHPESRSPFGVDDAAGNVWEWVAPAPGTSGGVARGGSFFHGAIAARAANRSVLDRSFRDGTLGLRVCVTPEPAFRGIRVRSLSGDP